MKYLSDFFNRRDKTAFKIILKKRGNLNSCESSMDRKSNFEVKKKNQNDSLVTQIFF